jgi:hypothetical protein
VLKATKAERGIKTTFKIQVHFYFFEISLLPSLNVICIIILRKTNFILISTSDQLTFFFFFRNKEVIGLTAEKEIRPRPPSLASNLPNEEIN